VNFNNTNKYTIAGTSTLTLDNTSNAVGVTVNNGSHDITAPLALAKDTTFTVAPAASTLTVSNLQSSNVSITKAGSGRLAVNNVRAGSLNVSAGSVSIIAGRSTAGTSKIGSLSITAGAALNLNDQDMAVDYTGSSPIATILTYIQNGYAGGAWTGAGLTSSAAAAASATASKTALGYGEASVVGLGGGTFSGQAVDGTAVLIRYTYAGDANFDGTVDTTDFNNLASNFSQSGKMWTNGDFNYDNTVDSVDFNLLASNFSKTLAAQGSIGAAVPEPASFASIASLVSMVLARRRRS
jgi:hypothetical protein